MQWQAKGLIFQPDQQADWLHSHAQVPTVLVAGEELFIYFATRDRYNKSRCALLRTSFAALDSASKLHPEIVLDLGRPGTFDQDGVMPSSIIKHNDQLYLYYTGWNACQTTPYHNAIGVAVSNDGGYTFTRVGEGPILDRTLQEPYIAITPYVLKQGDVWHMWYASGIEWLKTPQAYEPRYVIKYACSHDGIAWRRQNTSCLKLLNTQEVLVRPTVLYEQDTYHMWFSFRDCTDYRDGEHSYCIGYACSQDGHDWQRRDAEILLNETTPGWDCHMQAYPYVVKHGEQYYLFYNGNHFGQFGFGYAIGTSHA